jgi:hypothetical protein
MLAPEVGALAECSVLFAVLDLCVNFDWFWEIYDAFSTERVCYIP